MKKSLVDKTVERIVYFIKKQSLSVGDKLPNEYTLAKQLEVGRSTLREAIKVLVSQGILEVQHGSGTYINSLEPVSELTLLMTEGEDSLKVAKDMFEVRLLIEPRMAALAAQNVTDEEAEIIETIAKALEADLESDNEFHRDLDMQFHTAIAEASGNIAMKELIPVIIQSITLYNDYFTDQQSKEETIRAHDRIVQAIKNKNPIEAFDAMTMHMEYNRRILIQISAIKEKMNK